MPSDTSATAAASATPRYAMRPEGSSVHSSVAGEIGQRIVRGEYPPGSILPNEAKWAETFKVSRPVVREAVKMLDAKSLLASRSIRLQRPNAARRAVKEILTRTDAMIACSLCTKSVS